MEYKLGVIGGMGPKATSVFMDKVIEHTVADKDQEHINMLVLNHASLPDRTEMIMKKKTANFLEAIKRDIQLLELAGVEQIAIPCNTSHYFYEQIAALTQIKIINMVEETVKEVHRKHGAGSKVGLLATRGTLESGIYAQSCQKYNLELYLPEASVQEQIMEIIYHHVKGDLDTDASSLEAIIEQLVETEQCQCVILACTELSCLQLSAEAAAYTFDAMDVLVKESILRSGKEWQERRAPFC